MTAAPLAEQLADLELDPRVYVAAAGELQRGRRPDRVALEYRLTDGQLAWIRQQVGRPLELFPAADQLTLFGSDVLSLEVPERRPSSHEGCGPACKGEG